MKADKQRAEFYDQIYGGKKKPPRMWLLICILIAFITLSILAPLPFLMMVKP